MSTSNTRLCPRGGGGVAEACMHTHRLSPIQHGDCTRDCTLDYILATYLGRQRKDCTTVAAHTRNCMLRCRHPWAIDCMDTVPPPCSPGLGNGDTGRAADNFWQSKNAPFVCITICAHCKRQCVQRSPPLHACTHRPPSAAAKACLYEATGWPIDASHGGMIVPRSMHAWAMHSVLHACSRHI